MSNLGLIKAVKLIRILERLGFVKINRESHGVSSSGWQVSKRSDAQGKGCCQMHLAKILKDVGLTYEEFVGMR